MDDVTSSLREKRGRMILLGLVGLIVVAVLAFFFVIKPSQTANQPTFVYFRLKT